MDTPDCKTDLEIWPSFWEPYPTDKIRLIIIKRIDAFSAIKWELISDPFNGALESPFVCLILFPI